MSDLQQKIAKSLIRVRLGLTVAELADEWNIKPLIINGARSQMQHEETIEKGEFLEGEGQLWIITEKGIKQFGNKADQPIEPPKKKRGRPRKVQGENNAL